MNHSILSHDFLADGRSPEVSLAVFSAQPLDLHSVPLMDMGFVVVCPLAPHRLPQIQFLYIGSRFAPRFFRTPPHGDAFALRYHFTSTRL